MEVFGEDGPIAMPRDAPTTDEQRAANEMANKSKERYLKFFMVDFIEMSMRKVAYQNIVFCSKEAKLFENLAD